MQHVDFARIAVRFKKKIFGIVERSGPNKEERRRAGERYAHKFADEFRLLL